MDAFLSTLFTVILAAGGVFVVGAAGVTVTVAVLVSKGKKFIASGAIGRGFARQFPALVSSRPAPVNMSLTSSERKQALRALDSGVVTGNSLLVELKPFSQACSAVQGSLPGHVRSELLSIRDGVAWVANLYKQAPLPVEDGHTLHSAITVYLLPSLKLFASLNQGKVSAMDSQMESNFFGQVHIVEAAVSEVATRLRDLMKTELQVNGLFLEDKFGNSPTTPNLTLESPPES